MRGSGSFTRRSRLIFTVGANPVRERFAPEEVFSLTSEPKVHVIRNFPIAIDLRAVKRRIGYKPGAEMDEKVSGVFDRAVARARRLAAPQAVYIVDKISEHTDDRVELECGFVVKSRQVSRMLRNCREAVLFAATIGADAETQAAELMKSRPTEGMILDAAAGEAAEGAVEYLHRSAQKEAHRRNLHLTPRFSPGYGDWPLPAQREVFACLGPSEIGIELTEACMMVPRKSVTGIFGLGPLPGIRTGGSPCKNCAKKRKK